MPLQTTVHHHPYIGWVVYHSTCEIPDAIYRNEQNTKKKYNMDIKKSTEHRM